MAKQQKNEVSFEDVLARRCGLDINKKEIVATVSGTDIKKEKRTFQATTRSLTQLKEWLLELGVTHVVSEFSINL
jgi:transposase